VNPIVSFLLRYIVVPLLIGISAFFYGQHVGKTECEAKTLKAAQAAVLKQDAAVVAAQTKDQASVDADATRQAAVRETYRDAPRIIQLAPVYRSSCIDAAGVQLLARAATAANGGDAPSAGSDDPAAKVQPATSKR
jgi:hypothetical protein